MKMGKILILFVFTSWLDACGSDDFPAVDEQIMCWFEQLESVDDALTSLVVQDFDLKEFRRTILLAGVVPLGVLEKVIGHYIAAKKNGQLVALWSSLKKSRPRLRYMMESTSPTWDRTVPGQLKHIPDRLISGTRIPS